MHDVYYHDWGYRVAFGLVFFVMIRDLMYS